MLLVAVAIAWATSRPEAPVPTVAAAPGAPSVLLIGDSYTRGQNGSGTHPGYVPGLCSAMRWSCTIDAVDGTGFVATIKGDDTFGTRLTRSRIGAPQLVLLIGGLNDARISASVAEERAAVVATLAAARRRYPSSSLIVVGPMSDGRWSQSVVASISGAIESAAVSQAVTFLQAADWLPAADLGPDGIHPTQRGYAVIAQRFAAALAPLTSSLPTSAPR
ncbi:MAG TPA: SGNH/GDSL hydrolase family protein [Jatrophihabitans sp.]